MSNVMIAYPNLADDAVLTNGSFFARLPAANVQDFRSAKVARTISTTLTDTILDADLGESRVIKVVSLPNHNFSIAATIRVRAENDPTFAVTLFDSGFVDALPEIYPSGVLDWGDAGLWDGKLGQQEYDDGYPIPWTLLIAPPVSARYWRFEISDVTNPDGFIDLGRLVISPGYSPTINMKQGLQIGWETSSSTTETDGGAFFHNDRVRRRFVNFQLSQIPENEGFVRLFELQRGRGMSNPFLFIYNPEDTFHLHRRAFLATFRRLNPLQVPHADRTVQAFQAVEEL